MKDQPAVSGDELPGVAIEMAWALSYTLMLVGLGGTVMALLLARRQGTAAAASPV